MSILCIKVAFSGAIADALGLEEEKESLFELGVLGKHTDICKQVKTHRMKDDFTATQEADQSAVTWLMSEETTRPTCL